MKNYYRVKWECVGHLWTIVIGIESDLEVENKSDFFQLHDEAEKRVKELFNRENFFITDILKLKNDKC